MPTIPRNLSATQGFVLLLGIASTLTAAHAADPKLYWYSYSADSGETIRGQSVVRCDSKGKVKIAYGSGPNVRYSELVNQKFTPSVVADTAMGGDARLDMALDKDGNAFILHQDWSYQRVFLAFKTDSKWGNALVAKNHADNLDFYGLSIAVNDAGEVHMAFPLEENANAFLNYSKRGTDGKISDPEKVETHTRNGKWNSMTLDKDGKPIISNYLFGNTSVAIYKRGDTQWDSSAVDTVSASGQHGFHNTLVRGADDKYRIAYIHRDNHALMFAEGQLGSMELTRIDTVPNWTLFTTQVRMAISSKNVPYLVYPRMSPSKTDENVAGESQLILAYRPDSIWIKVVLDSAGIAGEWASIGMTPDDLPVISYFERSKRVLRVLLGSTTEPADANMNGIPDYKEIVAIRATRLTRAPSKAAGSEHPIDALGRLRALPGQLSAWLGWTSSQPH